MPERFHKSGMRGGSHRGLTNDDFYPSLFSAETRRSATVSSWWCTEDRLTSWWLYRGESIKYGASQSPCDKRHTFSFHKFCIRSLNGYLAYTTTCGAQTMDRLVLPCPGRPVSNPNTQGELRNDWPRRETRIKNLNSECLATAGTSSNCAAMRMLVVRLGQKQLFWENELTSSNLTLERASHILADEVRR